jgi:hypothetical protein
MKQVLIIVMLLQFAAASAQENAICMVTSVKGVVFTTYQKRLRSGDTIAYNNAQRLQFQTAGVVTLYHPQAGSFRVYTRGAYTPEHKESFVDFVGHLLKVKGKTIALSSRGDCECLTVQDCVRSDAELNDQLLLVDTLYLPLQFRPNSADSSFYFLQRRKNGRSYNRVLQVTKRNVLVTASDLQFEGEPYVADDEEPVSIGFSKIREGKREYQLLARFKPNVQNQETLRDYFNALQTARAGSSSAELFQNFYTDVYILFGKPDACRLKQIVHFKEVPNE